MIHTIIPGLCVNRLQRNLKCYYIIVDVDFFSIVRRQLYTCQEQASQSCSDDRLHDTEYLIWTGFGGPVDEERDSYPAAT